MALVHKQSLQPLECESKVVEPYDLRTLFVKFEPGLLTADDENLSKDYRVDRVCEQCHLCCVAGVWQNIHCTYRISCWPLETMSTTENAVPSVTAARLLVICTLVKQEGRFGQPFSLQLR